MSVRMLEKLLTVDELADLPDDGKRYELHQGAVVEVGTSGRRHTVLGLWIGRMILNFILASNLGGEVTGADGTYKLTEHDTSVPDIGYISKAKTDLLPKGTVFYPFAPDLAIEIRSPSQSKREMSLLAILYLHAGAPLVWIIDLDAQQVTVYRANGERFIVSSDGALDGEEVLPGFSIPLPEMFNVIKDM